MQSLDQSPEWRLRRENQGEQVKTAELELSGAETENSTETHREKS